MVGLASFSFFIPFSSSLFPDYLYIPVRSFPFFIIEIGTLIMPCVLFVLFSCALIATGHSEIDMSSSPIDLPDGVTLDSPFLESDSQFDIINSLAQAFESNPNMLPDEDAQSTLFADTESSPFLADIDMNQISGSDAKLFLADEIGCEGSNAANSQLFGKVRRRGISCQTGDSIQSGDQNDLPDLGFNDFAVTLELELTFSNDDRICPTDRFGISNIPVCKVPEPHSLFPVLGAPWVNLRNVAPGTFHCFLSF